VHRPSVGSWLRSRRRQDHVPSRSTQLPMPAAPLLADDNRSTVPPQLPSITTDGEPSGEVAWAHLPSVAGWHPRCPRSASPPLLAAQSMCLPARVTQAERIRSDLWAHLPSVGCWHGLLPRRRPQPPLQPPPPPTAVTEEASVREIAWAQLPSVGGHVLKPKREPEPPQLPLLACAEAEGESTKELPWIHLPSVGCWHALRPRRRPSPSPLPPPPLAMAMEEAPAEEIPWALLPSVGGNTSKSRRRPARLASASPAAPAATIEEELVVGVQWAHLPSVGCWHGLRPWRRPHQSPQTPTLRVAPMEEGLAGDTPLAQLPSVGGHTSKARRRPGPLASAAPAAPAEITEEELVGVSQWVHLPSVGCWREMLPRRRPALPSQPQTPPPATVEETPAKEVPWAQLPSVGGHALKPRQRPCPPRSASLPPPTTPKLAEGTWQELPPAESVWLHLPSVGGWHTFHRPRRRPCLSRTTSPPLQRPMRTDEPLAKSWWIRHPSAATWVMSRCPTEDDAVCDVTEPTDATDETLVTEIPSPLDVGTIQEPARFEPETADVPHDLRPSGTDEGDQASSPVLQPPTCTNHEPVTAALMVVPENRSTSNLWQPHTSPRPSTITYFVTALEEQVAIRTLNESVSSPSGKAPPRPGMASPRDRKPQAKPPAGHALEACRSRQEAEIAGSVLGLSPDQMWSDSQRPDRDQQQTDGTLAPRCPAGPPPARRFGRRRPRPHTSSAGLRTSQSTASAESMGSGGGAVGAASSVDMRTWAPVRGTTSVAELTPVPPSEPRQGGPAGGLKVLRPPRRRATPPRSASQESASTPRRPIPSTWSKEWTSQNAVPFRYRFPGGLPMAAREHGVESPSPDAAVAGEVAPISVEIRVDGPVAAEGSPAPLPPPGSGKARHARGSSASRGGIQLPPVKKTGVMRFVAPAASVLHARRPHSHDAALPPSR